MSQTQLNSSFSQQLPGLQLAIDSTSLGAFKLCPRFYQLSIIDGWEPRGENVHFAFGIWLHGGRERYDHSRSAGANHDEALETALRWVLIQTWNKELSRPWLSDHNVKTRMSLIRTLIWYLDQYGENDALTTVMLANGKPAVELSFRFDLGFVSQTTGEAYQLCGHIDRVAQLNNTDLLYGVDLKSTTGQLGTKFFHQFSPNNQMSLYDLAGKIAFGYELEGMIIDAAQIGVTFSRFERALVPRKSSQRDEWLASLVWWLGIMEQAAITNNWPMNESNCITKYGECKFLEVCSRPPGSRRQWLEANYTKRVWDPLQVRGDV